MKKVNEPYQSLKKAEANRFIITARYSKTWKTFVVVRQDLSEVFLGNIYNKKVRIPRTQEFVKNVGSMEPIFFLVQIKSVKVKGRASREFMNSTWGEISDISRCLPVKRGPQKTT